MRRALSAVACGVLLLARPEVPVRAAGFPAWDGVRPSYRNDIWRMTGRLIASDGRAFSYAATFFRYGEPNGITLYPATVSVLDERNGRRFSERRTERGDLGLADAAAGDVNVRVGTWRLRETHANGGVAPAFDLDARLEGMALQVHAVARKRRFAIRSAPAEQDEYSSLASTGTVAESGQRVTVAGKSWLACEHSNERPPPDERTAQVRVQLDDGRELYLESSGATEARSRRRAYLVRHDGSVVTLAQNTYAFGTHPGSTWLSVRTRIKYPDIWGLYVVDQTPFLSLEPVAYDQESIALGDGDSFWDGAVEIYDVTPGSQGLRLGSGYVLMHGYAPEPRIR